jgi:YHS domain-containing protein
MKTKRLAVFAIASILGFGIVAGCTAPGSNPSSSPEPSAETGPIESYPDYPESPTEENTSPSPEATNTNEVFYEDDGLAIRGYDPVAYFTEGQPVEGSQEFSYQWGNATWRFASAENRDLFVNNPEQYAPQYGGFCAWAVSQGYTAAIDPNAWKIVDGRLYLNATRGVQRRWERDIPGHIAQGDQNWPGIREDLISQR